MEDLETENKALKTTLYVIFAVGNFFFNALVVKTLWSWLVVPITGFGKISFITAMAGMFFVDYALYRNVDTKNSKPLDFERLLQNFVYMVLSLIIGFVIHLFL